MLHTFLCLFASLRLDGSYTNRREQENREVSQRKNSFYYFVLYTLIRHPQIKK